MFRYIAALIVFCLLAYAFPAGASVLSDEYDGPNAYRCDFDMYRLTRIRGESGIEWRRDLHKAMRADNDGEAYTKTVKWFREKSPHARLGWHVEMAGCVDVSVAN